MKNNFSRIILTSFLLIVLMLTPFGAFVLLNSQQHSRLEVIDETVQDAMNRRWQEDPSSSKYLTVSRLAMLSLVCCFGALRSVISLLSRRQKEAEIVVNASISELIVINTVGAIFALILMVFFWGGLISGALFPLVNFSPDVGGVGITIYRHEDLAKLIVWSFIAGFSERLVPQLIENIQKKARLLSEDK